MARVSRRGVGIAAAFAVAVGAATAALMGSANANPVPVGAEELVPGNPTCLSLDPVSGLIELKVDPPVSGETYTDGVLEVTIALTKSSAGQLLEWSANIGIDSVVVKGGNAANRYSYQPEATADSGLHAPANRNGKYADVSHVSFCYDIEQEEQGCSPGYWKQTHHATAWQPTGYTPDQAVSSVFTGAPTPNSSLQAALGTGGGGSTALVRVAIAALLSAAHPDVNYPYSAQQVIDLTNGALGSGNAATINNLKDALEAVFNVDGHCPLS